MELKPRNFSSVILRHIVLIVPYGIETDQNDEYQTEEEIVLIVPYGIETKRID